MNKKTKKKLIRFRHLVGKRLAWLYAILPTVFKYHAKIKKFREPKKRNYLILYNHQTPFDQFFVGMAFKGIVYYVATDDIFSKGWISSLIRFFVSPIPIQKSTVDISAVMNCIRIAKEGGTIAIAPEGNRTYSGKTGNMRPGIAMLAKKLKLPIALFRIEGGYGVEPRWSDTARKGKMRAYVSEIIEPEVYGSMTDEELFALIRKGLDVDESKPSEETYSSAKSAEHLERVFYYCPSCGFSKWTSSGKTAECSSCHSLITYTDRKELQGINCRFPFRSIGDWYDAQEKFVMEFNPNEHTDSPLFTDSVQISRVIPRKKKINFRKSAVVKLYGNRVTVDEGTDRSLDWNFDNVSSTSVLGRHKCNLFVGESIYQLRGDKDFNALKYVNLFYRYHANTEVQNDQFLGL